MPPPGPSWGRRDWSQERWAEPLQGACWSWGCYSGGSQVAIVPDTGSHGTSQPGALRRESWCSQASPALCVVQRPPHLHTKPSQVPAVEVTPSGASYNPTFEDHQVHALSSAGA